LRGPEREEGCRGGETRNLDRETEREHAGEIELEPALADSIVTVANLENRAGGLLMGALVNVQDQKDVKIRHPAETIAAKWQD
jgi:hypothetical protein